MNRVSQGNLNSSSVGTFVLNTVPGNRRISRSLEKQGEIMGGDNGNTGLGTRPPIITCFVTRAITIYRLILAPSNRGTSPQSGG